MERLAAYPALVELADAAAKRVEDTTGDDAETLITDGRYAFISTVIKGALTRPREAIDTTSDKIDRVLTHRYYGVPIFLLLMWTVFQITANVSAPFLDWVDGVINGPITTWTASILAMLRLDGTWFEALLVDGVIAGVGGVLVFGADVALSGDWCAGRQRIHGSCCLCNGSRDAGDGIAWKELPADAGRLRLHGSGSIRDAHTGKRR